MKKITVGSPDKLSLKMFTNFLLHCLGKDYEVGDMHYLMTPENQQKFAEHMNEFDKSILLYYSRKKTGPDHIPQILTEMSDVVVWFDRYSVEPKILKDEGGFRETLMDRWKMNIDRLSKLNGQ